MSSRISQQQLKSYLWGAATLLRGTIDAGDYKQFIFPLLFYKRLCDGFLQRSLRFLVEYVAQALVEQQREDELLVVTGVDRPPEQRRRTPEVGFQLLLSNLAHS